MLTIANAHFDPLALGALRSACDRIAADEIPIRVVWPDLTRRPWAGRLTEEFRSGACHAGQYETSVVMACQPNLVNEPERIGLPDNPSSLSAAIRAGRTSFESAGGDRAYFGYPARASVAEGHETVATLGAILAEAVLESGPVETSS